MKQTQRQNQAGWSMKQIGIGLIGVSMAIVIGIGGCNWFEQGREDSPTTPASRGFALGNYMQQTGQSRVATVNGETHQINGMISGSVVADGLYIEINEQSSPGQPAGTDQVTVSLQDVKITFTGLPSGVSAITVLSSGTEIGQYAATDGSVEIALSAAQWTQWFGATHYAAVCLAVGSGRLTEAMAAVSGRLPSGEVVTFGIGFAPDCPVCPPCTGGGTCPSCTGGTCNPNALPVFVNNGNGTITDTRTGLIWLQNANCLGGTRTHADATTWATTVLVGNGTMCGLNDGSTAGQWRLPTVTQLQDLIDYSRSGPALPSGHPFTNVQSDWYWTSTDYAPIAAAAWGVYLDAGFVANDAKTGTGYAWAVR